METNFCSLAMGQKQEQPYKISSSYNAGFPQDKSKERI